MSNDPPRSRLRRVFLTSVALMLAGVVLTAAFVLWPRGSGIPVNLETTHLLGPLDKHGYVDYEAAAGPWPAAEDNAAGPYVIAAAGLVRAEVGDAAFGRLCQKLGIDPPDDGAVRLIEFEAFAETFETGGEETADEEEADDELCRATGRPWRDENCPRVAEWLDESEAAIELVVDGTRRPAFRLRGGQSSTPLDEVLPFSSARGVFRRALVARAMRRIGGEDFRGAAADIDATYRLARHVNADPTFMEALDANAVNAAAFRADVRLIALLPTAAMVEQRRRTAAARRPLRAVVDAMERGERFAALRLWQDVDRAGRGLPTRGPSFLPNSWNGRMAGRWCDAAYGSRETNRTFDAIVDVLRLSPAERAAGVRKLATTPSRLNDKSQVIADLWWTGALLGYLWNSSEELACQSAIWAETRRPLLDVAIAARLFELDSGRAAAAPNDLVPAYLAKWPTDPFTGGPLTHRTSDDVWTVVAGEGAIEISFGKKSSEPTADAEAR